MKNPGIKIPFLSIENPVVEGTRCIEIRVPDDDVYVRVLASLVSVATRWFNYQRDAAHTGQELAKMWSAAYVETDWEGCMTCQDVTDCIETDEGTQQAITNIYQTTVGGQTPISTNGQGSNLIGGVPGCAYSNLFGAMRALVEWLNENNIDFLDRIAAASTPAERGAVMSEEIPGFTGVALGASLSAAMSFMSSALHNEYDTHYDQIYADDLTCELFCFAQDDCEITIRQLYLILAARVGYTDPADLFYQGLLFAVSGSWTGTNYCDVMMFLQVGAFLFMGGFAGYTGLNPLSNALGMGFDQPDDDWIDLCDCPDSWVYTINSATMPSWVEIPLDATIGGIISGTVIDSSVTNPFGSDIMSIGIKITFPTVQVITGTFIHQISSDDVESVLMNNHFMVYRDAGGVNIGGTDIELPQQNGAWDVSFTEAIPGVKEIIVLLVFHTGTEAFTWDNITIAGKGVNPFV